MGDYSQIFDGLVGSVVIIMIVTAIISAICGIGLWELAWWLSRHISITFN